MDSRWWRCAPCDVKWVAVSGLCWSCGARGLVTAAPPVTPKSMFGERLVDE